MSGCARKSYNSFWSFMSWSIWVVFKTAFNYQNKFEIFYNQNERQDQPHRKSLFVKPAYRDIWRTPHAYFQYGQFFIFSTWPQYSSTFLVPTIQITSITAQANTRVHNSLWIIIYIIMPVFEMTKNSETWGNQKPRLKISNKDSPKSQSSVRRKTIESGTIAQACQWRRSTRTWKRFCQRRC